MDESIRFENYELLRRPDGSPFELGRGAMGVTYKARDTDLHCDVALKVISPEIIGHSDVRERFLREARAAARLRHPNIATVFRLGVTADGTHYYAMELCDGITLHEALQAWGPLTAATAVHLAWQVSKALRLAEEHRLIHRDLKPANLIVTQPPDEGLVIKVIDFGLAKSFAEGHQTLFLSGAGFAGTAHFASPEQVDERELDIRSDIYSLGACLWFMLTGHPPFEGPIARVMSQTLTAEPPWEQLIDQPACVIALLRRMLAKRREDRQATVTALRMEMERCLQSMEAQANAKEPATAAAGPGAGSDAEGPAPRFQLGEPLGRNSLGCLFRATDRENGGTAVTCLVIDPTLLAAPAMRRELEAQLAAARTHPHPNLVNVLASTDTGQGFMVATEQLAGFTLLEFLKDRGALSPQEALLLLSPLAAAADHASTCGVRGLALRKGQTWVHFPNDVSGGNRRQALAESVSNWSPHVLKVEILSLAGAGGDNNEAPPSMAIRAFPGQSLDHAQYPAAASLAHLACELLGGSANGAFTPLPRLSKNANTILRRACTEPAAFRSAAAFLQAVRPTLGKASAPQSKTPSHAHLTPAPPLVPPPARVPSRLLALSVVVLAGASLAVAYYYGIHEIGDRDRQQLSTTAEMSPGNPENKKKREPELEHLPAEAEKAKASGAINRLEAEQAKRKKAMEETAPANRFEDLIAQGKTLREHGDTSLALTRFREAGATNPQSPLPIAELATTYEKMGLADKAGENWRQIFDMGESAGIYFSLAEAKLKVAMKQAADAAVSPSKPVAVEGIAPGMTLGLLPITVEEQWDPASAKKFTLKIPIKSRPHAKIDPHELVIHVIFYDILNGQSVVLTSAIVSSRWLAPPADWVEKDTEDLAVAYQLPKPESQTRENRRYYGYIVRIYYKNQLQGAVAVPELLGQKYPPSPTLPKDPEK